VLKFGLLARRCSGKVPDRRFSASSTVLKLDMADHPSGIDPPIKFCSRLSVRRRGRKINSRGKVPAKLALLILVSEKEL
jgi:hypothetical protein